MSDKTIQASKPVEYIPATTGTITGTAAASYAASATMYEALWNAVFSLNPALITSNETLLSAATEGTEKGAIAAVIGVCIGYALKREHGRRLDSAKDKEVRQIFNQVARDIKQDIMAIKRGILSLTGNRFFQPDVQSLDIPPNVIHGMLDKNFKGGKLDTLPADRKNLLTKLFLHGTSDDHFESPKEFNARINDILKRIEVISRSEAARISALAQSGVDDITIDKEALAQDILSKVLDSRHQGFNYAVPKTAPAMA